MLLKMNYYLIKCDTCGKETSASNKTQAKFKWQQAGGFICKGNKCFCSEECYKLYNERLRNEANH